MKINLGSSDSKQVYIDLDVLLRTRLLVQASSGGGKSWLLRRLMEQLFGKVQVIVIDPEGEFATIREKYGYVLVGKGGETPADKRSAALVAHKLLELRASAVCDLYEVTPRDRHTWVKLFLEALIDAPKKLWHPLVVIIDESHVFAPEKGAGESEASEAMIGLATRGRKRGFCAVFATQRLGKLRKDAAAELLNILIGQTFIDIDRKRAAEALGIAHNEQRAFFDDLRLLKPGNFWGLGRAIATERILFKVGPVETTHPELGSSKHSAEPPPPPEQVKELLPKLSDLPQQAEAKAKNEAELRSEIRSLKAQLSARPKDIQVKTETKVERVEVPILKDSQIKQLEAIAARYERESLKLGEVVLIIHACVKDAIASAKPVQNIPKTITAPRPVVERLKQNLYKKPADAPPGGSTSNGFLPEGERLVLSAIAQYQEGVLRDQLSVLTGYKRSTRDAYIQRLFGKNYVQYSGSGLIATQEGIDALGPDFEPLPTGEALQQYWINKLPEGERKILDFLISAYPNPADRDRISEATGYKRSTRDAYIQRLTARKLCESDRAGVVASATLFEE
jgi:hypothetical protein